MLLSRGVQINVGQMLHKKPFAVISLFWLQGGTWWASLNRAVTTNVDLRLAFISFY